MKDSTNAIMTLNSVMYVLKSWGRRREFWFNVGRVGERLNLGQASEEVRGRSRGEGCLWRRISWCGWT